MLRERYPGSAPGPGPQAGLISGSAPSTFLRLTRSSRPVILHSCIRGLQCTHDTRYVIRRGRHITKSTARSAGSSRIGKPSNSGRSGLLGSVATSPATHRDGFVFLGVGFGVRAGEAVHYAREILQPRQLVECLPISGLYSGILTAEQNCVRVGQHRRHNWTTASKGPT